MKYSIVLFSICLLVAVHCNYIAELVEPEQLCFLSIFGNLSACHVGFEQRV